MIKNDCKYYNEYRFNDKNIWMTYLGKYRRKYILFCLSVNVSENFVFDIKKMKISKKNGLISSRRESLSNNFWRMFSHSSLKVIRSSAAEVQEFVRQSRFPNAHPIQGSRAGQSILSISIFPNN